MRAVAAPDDRKLSRAERKERTRQQLIDAAAELARTEGVAGVTTTRITARVGVTQPAFYVHFKNVDECLGVAAEQLAGRMLSLIREARVAVRADPGGDIRGAISATLTVLLSEPPLLQVFLQYRRDRSTALGRTLAAAYDQARAELAEDLELGAKLMGLERAGMPPPAAQADLLTWVALGAAEDLLDQRSSQDQLVDVLFGLVTAAIRSGPVS